MLYQGLSQKQLQKLSPQQIQLLSLMQIPTASLEQRIKEELEANPALEEGDSNSSEVDEFQEEKNESIEEFEVEGFLKEYMDDEPDSTNYNTYQSPTNTEDNRPITAAVANTFYDNLERQSNLIDLDEEEKTILHQIIGSIDEDGYLRRDIASILDDLMFGSNLVTTEEKIEEIIKIVQKFEPVGVGSRDLRECLMIQLEHKLEHADSNSYHETCLKKGYLILDKYFNEFSKKHYSRLIKQLDIEEDELKDIIEEIIKLNPKPASSYRDSRDTPTQYVVPDFFVYNREDEIELSLNSQNSPELHVNDQYKGMLRQYKHSHKKGQLTKKDKEAALFIKNKIDSAKWFIDAIKRRQDTLYSTMYAIVQYQKEYFLTGDEKKIKPMILKDIAQLTGFDISTVSRVANNKFVHTEFGTKLVKEFFSESVQNNDGEEISTLEVKSILEELINNEDKIKPFSDQQLQELLETKGYTIARRTISKYREQLNIPVARLRKKL